VIRHLPGRCSTRRPRCFPMANRILRDLVNRDPEPTIDRLAELLPWNWKAARADSEWEQRAV
jgi:hypothetical protein